MLNIQQLQSFVTVVSEGSMTEAANKLYLTQPAISQQIRNLEEDLGVELLLRGTRTIRPTLQGEMLLEQARRILQLVQQAENSIKMLGSQLSGHLRIGTLNSLGVQLVSPVIGRLLKLNPQVSFRVDFDEESQLVKKYNQQELDVVILPENVMNQIRTEQPRLLLKEEMWLVGSSKDTQIPRQVSLKELNQFSLMWLTREYSDFELQLTKELSTHRLEFRPNFSTSNVGTLKRVIETGLGWGFLPSMAVRKQVRSGRMINVQVKDFQYYLNFYYCQNAELSKEQRALAEALFVSLTSLERS